jgi:hypothetical protein
MASVDMATFAAQGGSVHITCRAPGCEAKARMVRWWGLTLTAADAAKRWRTSITVAEIRERYRCPICGHRGEHIWVDVSAPMEFKTGLGDGPVIRHWRRRPGR